VFTYLPAEYNCVGVWASVVPLHVGISHTYKCGRVECIDKHHHANKCTYKMKILVRRFTPTATSGQTNVNVSEGNEYLLGLCAGQPEEVICKGKCVCWREVSYNDILIDLEYYEQTDGDTTFQRVEHARLNMISTVCELVPNALVFGSTDMICGCHRENHWLTKSQVGKLKDVEQQLVGAIHFHPLIRGHHVCFLCFAAAAEYKVELAVCDTDLAMKEAIAFACIPEGVRDLYV
jgi:hypothetical protein